MNISEEYHKLGEALNKVKFKVLFLERHAATALERLELVRMKENLKEIFLSFQNAQSAFFHQEEAQFLMGKSGYTLISPFSYLEFSKGHYSSFHEDEHEWALKGCRTCITKLMSTMEKHKNWKDCCPDCLVKAGHIIRNEDLIPL
jgi:hypothetical protein